MNRLTEEGLEPEPFLRRFRTRTEAKILRARGRRAEGDARLREILPSLQFETRLRQLPTLVAAAGTGSDGEYQAALAEFLELFSVRRESHTGHIGLIEAMDVAIYRRDFDMLTRVLAVTEIQMMPGWFPALELWVEAVKLLLAWNQDRSSEDLRRDLSLMTERAHEVGQSPLSDLLRDVMAEHDRTLAASG